MGFDYFVGKLKCTKCGKISEADSSTNMQTYILKRHDNRDIGVGDEIDTSPENMHGSNYLKINEPKPNEDLVILETWECYYCDAPYLWAKIVVRNNKITEVSSVTLNRDTFMNAHYIKDACVSTAMDLSGLNYPDTVKSGIIKILKEKLK